jgi:hypothetical protein
MTGQKTPIQGFTFKDGRLVPIKKKKSVSAHIRQQKSKRQKCVSRAKAFNSIGKNK